MPTGTIKKISERGFGFIAQGAEANDIFFHATGMRNREEFDTIKPGDRVQFDIDHATDRPRAVDVVPVQ